MKNIESRVLAFLRRTASYPHRPRRIREVQTHASRVFIASPFVYKIKKPVNLGFLDFSTLARRRLACEREVELNRRLAPDVYLDVVPIKRHQGKLHFDGRGRTVEYAVQMRRLEAGGFLDQRLKRGALGRRELMRIAQVLARFYHSQPPSPDLEEWGRIDHLRISTDENFAQTKQFVGKTLTHPQFVAIREYTNCFYRRHVALFASRIAGHWIRDCHGDLHLEHIHLKGNAINIYDCIEFNERFRHIDVASDIAFLAMDLEFNGRADLASYFVKRMATLLKDPQLPAITEFYKCYRAYVRGKVESLQSISSSIDAAEAKEHATRASRYFQLALKHAVTDSQPGILILMGHIGSGKSTLARRLSAELGWPVFSSDRVRKELASVPAHQRVTGQKRERLYSDSMTARTYRALAREAERQVRVGCGAIIDATFSRKEQRAQLIQRWQQKNIPFFFVEATCPKDEIRRRLRSRDDETLEISDARLSDFCKLSAVYEPPHELSSEHCLKISTTKPVEQTIIQLLKRLGSRSRSSHTDL